MEKFSPNDIVDADDAVGPGGPGVVDYGGVALDPNPASVLRQKPVILGARLALAKN